MRILNYEPKYLAAMVSLFVEEYSKLENRWELSKAKEFIERDLEKFSDYCFLAIASKDVLAGYILCKREPLCSDYYLCVTSIQVAETFRGQALASTLLKKSIGYAKSKGLSGVILNADSRLPHPRDWYVRIGFQASGWVEYLADFKTLKLK